MCTVKELLKCAEINIEENGAIGKMLGLKQIKQYQSLIGKGVSEDEYVDDALEKFPECSLNNF